MVVTIPGNVHLKTSLEVHWLVSIHWRPQSSVYKLAEWAHLSDSAISAQALYDGWQVPNVTAEPILKAVGALPQVFDLEETTVELVVDRTRELDAHAGKTFEDFWDSTYPPAYADVFVTAVLDSGSDRTSVIVWAGAIEHIEIGPEEARITAVDQARKLLLPLTERMEKDEFADLSSAAVGQRKPLPLGQITQFTPPIVVEQLRTSLEEAVDAAATTLKVGSTEEFPTTGSVVIDDEIIAYTGKTADSLTGCTRAQQSTTSAAHDPGTVVFLATGATVDGQTVNGPVFLLSGDALAASAVTAVRAHSADGKGSYDIDAADYVVEEARAGGALLGLLRNYPQAPDQAADPAWWALEFDVEDTVRNQVTDWADAAGAASTFEETAVALVNTSKRLALARSAAVQRVGRSRIIRAYLLVEYANLTNPRADGKSVPNDGQNTEVHWLDDAGTSQNLGSLYPEEDPIEETIANPTRTVRTRPVEDQHRHSVSGGSTERLAEAAAVQLTSTLFHAAQDEWSPVGNMYILYEQGGGSGSTISAVQVSQALAAGSEDRVSSNLSNPTPSVDLFFADERFLIYAFYTAHSATLAAAFYEGSSYSGSSTGTIRVYNARRTQQFSGTLTSYTQVFTYESLNGDFAGVTFAELLPLIVRGEFVGNSSSASRMDWGGFDGINIALQPPATPRPVTVLQATDVEGASATEKTRWLAAASGTKQAHDRTTEGGEYDSSFKIKFDAPNATAEVKRVTCCWLTDDPTVVTKFKLRKADGTLLGTFDHQGDVLDLTSDALTVADLDQCRIRPDSSNSTTPYRTHWLRLIVEYEGSLTADDEYAARRSSLKVFEITDHLADLDDWQSLVQSTAGRRAIEIRSPDSTGSFDSNPTNNDSLWILRASFLLETASPITALAPAVSATYKGHVGANSVAAESRAIGDLILELLQDATFLGIDGTEYWASGGWIDTDSFHSDQNGPTELGNGVYLDTEDTPSLVADLAAQAMHSIYIERGRFRLQEILTSGWAAAARTLTDADLAGDPQVFDASAEAITNTVIVEYDRDWIRRGYQATEKRTDSGSQTKYGARRDHTQAMSANDTNSVDNPTTVQVAQAGALADSLLARFKEQRKAVKWAMFLNGIDLELGNIVAFNATALVASKVEITRMVVIPGAQQAIDRIEFEGIIRVE